MYIFTVNASVEVSIDGGGFQRYELTPIYNFTGTNNRGWKKLPITGNGNTLQSVILSGTGDVALRGGGGVITGILLEGTAVDLQAPTGTRRHVVQLGASQTEGVSANGLIDLHLAQDRLPIYALSAGWAGKTVAEMAVSTTFETWAATLPFKDILLISFGINDTDNATLQTNYQTLITKALTAGFNRVICRGLGFPVATFASKNTKMAAAVAAVADARVVYASIDTWTGVSGVHPNRAEYMLMADQSVADHAALYS
jgi:lysophospholipase L1-like esterase